MSGRRARLVLVPLLTACAIAFIIVLASMLGTLMGKPTGNHKLAAVEQEFERMAPPREADQLGPVRRVTQMSFAHVAASYASNLGYENLRSYYDAEAAAAGWSFCGEKPIRDWFQDLGGVTRTYCKGDLRAHLEYAGDRANYGWAFAFNVDWEVR